MRADFTFYISFMLLRRCFLPRVDFRIYGQLSFLNFRLRPPGQSAAPGEGLSARHELLCYRPVIRGWIS